MDTDFRAVTSSNMNEVLGLTIQDEQEGFIESMEECMQDAKEDKRYVPIGLYRNGEIVGFAMYGKFKDQVWFDRFLIDQQHQGQGLGKYFFEKMLRFLEEMFSAKSIYLSVFGNNDAAIHMYESFGFAFTGEVDVNGERIMQRDCQAITH